MEEFTQDNTQDKLIELCKSVQAYNNTKEPLFVITDGEKLYAVDFYVYCKFCKFPEEREDIIKELKLGVFDL